MIVSEFREISDLFPATNGQRSIATVVDRLTYIDEMVYGKPLTLFEPTVKHFIILSCSFPLILLKKKTKSTKRL